MKIAIWGTGYKERLIENYIREDVEIIACIDNNRNNWGKKIKISEQEVDIVRPDCLKDIVFDYCLIAVEVYPIIIKQCLEELMLPEEKIIQAVDLLDWDINLVLSIFDENVLENPGKYIIGGNRIDLGEGHALPIYQKQYKMYDRFLPFLGKMVQEKDGEVVIDIGANVGDTLAAMFNYTDDSFLCIEPVEEFYNLLIKNIRHMGGGGTSVL